MLDRLLGFYSKDGFWVLGFGVWVLGDVVLGALHFMLWWTEGLGVVFGFSEPQGWRWDTSRFPYFSKSTKV